MLRIDHGHQDVGPRRGVPSSRVSRVWGRPGSVTVGIVGTGEDAPRGLCSLASSQRPRPGGGRLCGPLPSTPRRSFFPSCFSSEALPQFTPGTHKVILALSRVDAVLPWGPASPEVPPGPRRRKAAGPPRGRCLLGPSDSRGWHLGPFPGSRRSGERERPGPTWGRGGHLGPWGAAPPPCASVSSLGRWHGPPAPVLGEIPN